jgi:tRNA/rRNA methyltransferase
VRLPPRDERPAPKADLVALMEHLEAALEPTGYFKSPDLRPRQVQNLRALLQRAGFTEPEIKVLRGVIGALEGRKRRREGG